MELESVVVGDECSGLDRQPQSARITCGFGRWRLEVGCTRRAPLTGPNHMAVSEWTGSGKTVEVKCPVGYYLPVGEDGRYHVNRQY